MRGWRKASFTVEASIIIPFVLFLTVVVLQMGIRIFQESCQYTPSEKWETFDAVSMFHKVQMIEEAGKEF